MLAIIQPFKDMAIIKKSLSMRCKACGNYFKGDPLTHLKEFHGGTGVIETTLNDYVTIPSRPTAPQNPFFQQ